MEIFHNAYQHVCSIHIVKTGIIAGLMVGVIAIFAYAGYAEGAVDMFLKIDSIDGESTDEAHKDWIDVLSFDWGITSNPGTASSGTPRTAVRADIQDFNFIKQIDKSSPKLFLAVANGQRIPNVEVDLTNPLDTTAKLLNLKFSDVIVTRYIIAGATQGSDVPIEQVSLNFAKVEMTYTETDKKTGAAIGDVKVNWDLQQNEGG